MKPWPSWGETVSAVKNQILADFLPAISDIVTAFSDMVNGVEGADTALAAAVENMVNAAVEKLPEFLNFGLEIIKAVVSGIVDNLPTSGGGSADPGGAGGGHH